MRRVVAAVLVAVFAGGVVGAAPAQAVGGPLAAATPVDVAKCADAGYSTMEALCAVYIALAREANKPDIEPRDMKVAAPSSVITATGSESPTRRVQEVNSWRPNPQSWIDAKTRLAGTSGVTTEALNATARWAPKLLKGASIAGVLSGDSLLTWVTRDGMLVPMLEKVAPQIDIGDTMNNTYCQRYGNVVTDWVAGWTGASCAEWRLDKDYNDLIAGGLEATGISDCFQGKCSMVVKAAEFGGNGTYLCVHSNFAGGALPSGREIVVDFVGTNGKQTNQGPWPLGTGNGFSATGCNGPGQQWWKMNWNGWTGSVQILGTYFQNVGGGNRVEALAPGKSAAEWMTRVRCMDGSSRFAVSESFQQEKLGGVRSPASVQLDGCKPVGVDVGVQKAGSGAGGSGGGWPSVPGGDRVGVQTGEVPQPVKDWMGNFPNCMDGSCLLELKKSVGGTMEIDCFSSPESCASWQEETATGSSTYNCYYAKTIVPLAECNVYGRTFEREKVQQGTGYSDPKTGETVKTSTGTTTTTNPGAASQSMMNPVADPDKKRECWPTGWGVLNPFEWVFKPVTCALEWAFVPRPHVLRQTQTKLQLKAANSKFAEATRVAQTWTAVFEAVNPSGCAGPSISLNLMGIQYTGSPLSACTEPGATLAFWSRTIIGIGAILIAVFAVTRNIGRVIGFGGIGRADGGD